MDCPHFFEEMYRYGFVAEQDWSRFPEDDYNDENIIDFAGALPQVQMLKVRLGGTRRLGTYP